MVKEQNIPYYAVIFTSLRTEVDEGYAEMNELLDALAVAQDGFLGMDSVRDELGISISYWRDEASINEWKQNADHVLAKKLGKEKWYSHYHIRIAKVEHEYRFVK